MDAQIFIDNLRDIATKFESWWCKPCEEFQLHYIKKNLGYRLINSKSNKQKLFMALKQFEENTRKQYDFIEDIYNFFDENYDAYRQATPEQRSEILSIVKKSYYPLPKQGINHYMEYFMGQLLLKYVKEKALNNIKSTGDVEWLKRGLVALSMENFTVSDLYTLTLLADLYVTSAEIGIYPDLHINRIANISSNGVKEMMTSIGSTRIVGDRRHDGFLVYKEFYDNP